MKKKILNILGILGIILFAFFIITLKVYCLESHQNAYIITGNSEHQLKYFVNIDHELVPNTNIFMSYSLLAKWNIYDKSSPFYYYNHNPSIFWQINNLWELDYIRLIPYEHMSNGLDGWESRGMDRYFIEMETSFGNKFNLGITEKVGGYYGYTRREGIPSPRRVYGFFKTTIFFQIDKRLGYFGDERIAVSGEWTKRFYWMQWDLTVRLFTSKFSPHLYLQWYNGYGEFLNECHKKTNAVRVGLIFKPVEDLEEII